MAPIREKLRDILARKGKKRGRKRKEKKEKIGESPG